LESMGKHAMLKPSDGQEGVTLFVLQAVADSGPNACPPGIIGVGVGDELRDVRLPELGTEAVRALEVEDFPVWVVNDCEGRDFYAETVRSWRKNDLLHEGLRIHAETYEGEGGGM